MDELVVGAIALGSAVAGLFFLRFWRNSRDRFFLYFALSFFIESLNRIFLGAGAFRSEETPLYYLIRVLAYGLILLAIWEKNRPLQPVRNPLSSTGKKPEAEGG